MAILQSLISAIYPDQCVLCEELTVTPHGLCAACWRDTPFLEGHGCVRCASPLPGAGDGTADLCDDCLTTPRPWAKAHAALAYDGRARSLVHRLKYSDRTDLARPAAAWLAARLRPHLTPRSLLVPVPAHRLRLLTRRYNQAALIARGVGKVTDAEVLVDGLLRRRATRKLDGLTLPERFAALKDAIVAHPRHRSVWQGRDVVIIDDVMTSGATLAAAAAAAHAAGAGRVDVAVLARTLKTP